MRKLLLSILISSLSFGQMTEEQDYIAEVLMQRDLTKQEQKTIDAYMGKKFVNEKVFMLDLERVVKQGLYIPTEYEANCAGQLIGSAKRDNYKLTNRTYEEVWDAARNFCREYVEKQEPAKVVERIEIKSPEKSQVYTKGSKEHFENKQIQFVKSKKGFLYKTELRDDIKTQIEKDFAKDGPGNYTAFYDVFYINDQLDRMKLKARLNR